MIRGSIQYDRPPDTLVKDLNAAVREGNAAAVEHWHEKFRPLHFTLEAKRRYNYQPRQGDDQPPVITSPGGRSRPNWAYSWRKRRKMGHNRPLVYTGDAERAANTVRVKSSTARGEGVYPLLPKYFFMYRKDLKQPNKAAEMVTVIQSEIDALATVAQRKLVESLNQKK